MSLWKRLLGKTDPVSPPTEESAAMRPLDLLMANLLETWGQRYAFQLDRDKWELALKVPGFELLATETDGGKIALTFEEAGKKHRVECPLEEAPRLIEALLFPENEEEG